MLVGQSQLTGSLVSRGAALSGRPGLLALMAGVMLLAGCASQQRAPVVDITKQQAPTETQAAPSSGATYVVKPRDTLNQIARNNNVSVDDLARWNNIADRNHLRIGQVLQLSSGGSAPRPGTGATQVGAASTAPGKIESRPLEPVGEAPASTEQPAQPATATPAPEPAKPAPRAADASLVNWAWPASGQIIQNFSATTKGIDIAGKPGDPVTAAADGKVMYSGNGVRGLGELIIINHQNGFITAYAHNRSLLVKSGQDVKRGAKIAEMGQTDTTSPRLHFEVRRQGTPVDPLRYLPPR